MALDGVARRYADALFQARSVELRKQYVGHRKLVIVDLAQRGFDGQNSGFYHSELTRVGIAHIDDLIQARADTLRAAYEKAGLPIDDDAVSQIQQESNIYADAQARNLTQALSGQVGRFNRGTNTAKALSRTVERAVSGTKARINFQLLALRDETLLTAKNAARREVGEGKPEPTANIRGSITDKWTRAEKLTAGCLIAAILAIPITVFFPEIRKLIHLDKPSQPQPATTPSPPPSAVSLHMGCGFNALPIHISAGSTAHVIRLLPPILRGNPQFPDLGVFDIISSNGRNRDWPSKSEGRWMTNAEFQASMAEHDSMPTPWVFECSIINYGANTIEKTLTDLIVDTSDGKRHNYPVYFDPLVSQQHFNFYVVNVCSGGTTATDVQWADSAGVNVLGETAIRRVPLVFEKRSFPSSFAVLGPSQFVWNGVQKCGGW
jgi:hypothetical protein